MILFSFFVGSYPNESDRVQPGTAIGSTSIFSEKEELGLEVFLNGRVDLPPGRTGSETEHC